MSRLAQRECLRLTKAAHNRIVGNPERALRGYPTSRRLAHSLFTQLAGGDADVAVWRLPACGRAQCESRPVGLQACPSVSRSRSHCATGRCYSDPHTVESGVLHLPVTAASPVECIRFSATQHPKGVAQEGSAACRRFLNNRALLSAE